MTTVKINGKLGSNASVAIEELTGKLFAKPGIRIVGVVELAHIERTQPAPDEDKEPSVTLGIKHLEIARGGEQEHAIRDALKALYTLRSASGTLTETDDVQLSERTLQLTAGMVTAVDAARLRVALKNWAEYARRSSLAGNLTLTQMRDELRTVSSGLDAVLAWSESDGH